MPVVPTRCLSEYTFDEQIVDGTNCKGAWYEWSLMCEKAKWEGETNADCDKKFDDWQAATSRTLTPDTPSEACLAIPTDMDYECFQSWYGFWEQCYDE